MTRFHSELPFVQLNPGEWALAREPSLLVTILGSCVAVSLRHEPTRLAALCHAVLPEPGQLRDDGDSPRYVEAAILSMLRPFDAAGVARDSIEVKLFGGGEVLAAGDGVVRRAPSVGAMNVEKARGVLARERLRIVAEDVGGVRGRKILFNTATGRVLLRRLAKAGPGARPAAAAARTAFRRIG